jgi:S-adenosylmethionine hydrolase
MEPSGIVTLLTDFGRDGPYVAAMKGALLAVNPRVVLVDGTHDVAPQQILQGAFLLDAYWRYFPAGTVHVAVVDPGVGTPRVGVAMLAGSHYFVGPDNGLFSYLGRLATHVVRLVPGRHTRPEVSATFHGRDVFAPVAGYLSRGERLDALGERQSGVHVLAEAWPRRQGGQHRGTVLHVDRFGNLITNFRGEDLTGAAGVRLGRRVISRRVRTYADAPVGEPVWLVGSTDWVEVAMRDASAAQYLRVGLGDEARVE